MPKKTTSICDSVKSIFDIYNTYKFKMENQELLKKTNLSLSDEKIEIITNFIKLIEMTLKYIPSEDSKMLEMIYIKNKHYTEFDCCQSSFFLKRKTICTKFYNLLFSQDHAAKINELVYSWKLN